jgi:uncharacterized protein (TIGR03382 family)
MADPTPSLDTLHSHIDKAANVTGDALHRTVERAQSGAHSAVDSGAELAGKARSRYVQAHRKLGDCAGQQPVSTLAITAAVGAALALLLFHRRRRLDD